MSQMIADCKQCANLQKENAQLRQTHDEILAEMIKRTAYLCKFYDQFPEKEGHELLQKMRDEVQQEKQHFDEKMEALKKRNQSLEARIATQEMSSARLRQELTEAQKRIVDLEEELESEFDEDVDGEELDDDSDGECCCDCHDSSDEDESDDDYDSDEGEDSSDEESSDDEELDEQLKEIQATNTHLQENLDKATNEVEQLREENMELREKERQLEERLERTTDELFRYIVRYPQFVQHKTIEEAQAEINELRYKVNRLEEEGNQQSEADDWEEVATARISDFSEESSISSESSEDEEEEKENETQEEDDDGFGDLEEAKKEAARRDKLDHFILFCVFFFTFNVAYCLMTLFF